MEVVATIHNFHFFSQITNLHSHFCHIKWIIDDPIVSNAEYSEGGIRTPSGCEYWHLSHIVGYKLSESRRFDDEQTNNLIWLQAYLEDLVRHLVPWCAYSLRASFTSSCWCPKVWLTVRCDMLLYLSEFYSLTYRCYRRSCRFGNISIALVGFELAVGC